MRSRRASHGSTPPLNCGVMRRCKQFRSPTVNRRDSQFLCIAVLLLIGSHAEAHHSPARFDQQRDVTVEGVIRTFEWVNPHVYFHVAVRSDAGEDVVWVVEAQSPRVMSMFGWSGTSLRPGEFVTIAAHPLRAEGEPVALGRAVQKADGTTLKISWQPDEIREAIRREQPRSDAR